MKKQIDGGYINQPVKVQKQQIKEIYNTKDTTNEFLLKKGFYKFSFKEPFENEFIVLNFKENTWSSKVEEFMLKNYPDKDYSMKYLDYILDYREVER